MHGALELSHHLLLDSCDIGLSQWLRLPHPKQCERHQSNLLRDSLTRQLSCKRRFSEPFVPRERSWRLTLGPILWPFWRLQSPTPCIKLFPLNILEVLFMFSLLCPDWDNYIFLEVNQSKKKKKSGLLGWILQRHLNSRGFNSIIHL